MANLQAFHVKLLNFSSWRGTGRARLIFENTPRELPFTVTIRDAIARFRDAYTQNHDVVQVVGYEDRERGRLMLGDIFIMDI